MKLKFQSDLDYQRDAINAVVDVFEGLGVGGNELAVAFSESVGSLGMVQTELGIGNDLALHSEKLLSNLHAVQERNIVEKSPALCVHDDIYSFPNFSVEMETGTGKTYVYLRTLFELNKRYGLRKFIIVVPSVAIREGVTSSIKLMTEHFRALYGSVPFDDFVYSSRDLSKVRQFATANTLQIMVINIQAFQKDAGDIDDYGALSDEQRKKLNVIHQDQDRMSGRRPIEFIQASRPVLIIDEPQSVDNTVKAKRAINTLNPLFALRYSATHKNPYNLLYSLGPIQAYDRKLVKQIAVSSIEGDLNINQTFLRLDSIGYSGKAKTPSAKVTIFEDTPNGTREKSVTLKAGLDLSDHTNRTGYEGYVVDEIYAEPGCEYVRFANNEVLEPGAARGALNDDIMRLQIRQTVEEHFKKERNLQKQDKAVKVLSLFFIDKVDNYRVYDEQGNRQNGKLAQWFEEAYRDIAAQPQFSSLPKRDISAVHDGYFSVDKKRGKVVGLKETTGNTAADEETYALIMRDKERLLSEEEPLRFIFSHSALKEGWDNPNVFQICSLREFGTEQERRQTLGRGLRLAVDGNGDRIYDPAINRLTVIASESFENYARQLQADIEKDIGGGFKFGRVPAIAFARLTLADGSVMGQEQSQLLWQSLQQAGYLDANGDITQAFTPQAPGFILQLPAQFEPLKASIVEKLESYLFRGRVVDNRRRVAVTYNKRVELNEDFQALWERIKHKTRYRIEFSTEKLIESALERIRAMPEIKAITLTSNTTEAKITEAGFEAARHVHSPRAHYINSHTVLPDIVSFLQRETELTRGTLVQILTQCGRLNEFKLNPQSFMTEVTRQIHKALNELLVDGIQYEKIDGESYEMSLFDQSEIEAYLDRLYRVQYAEQDAVVRTPYDYMEYDSTVEKDIAQRLDEAENVRFFCKLPPWFKIATPIGNYNPDWAVVLEADKKLYLIRESKSSHDADDRRNKENLLIRCGAAHFAALGGVDYKIATNFEEIVDS
jgi:type III restriction enzyme